MTEIIIAIVGILVGFLGTFGVIWFRAGTLVATVAYVQKSVEDIKKNHLKHIDERMGRLFELHEDMMKRCNIHGERITENKTRLNGVEGRVIRCEKQVNGLRQP